MSTIHLDLDRANLSFLEELYETYLIDPLQLNDDWRHYFQGFNGRAEASNAPVPEAKPACGGADVNKSAGFIASRCSICGRQEQMAALQQRVDKLIRNYRVRGHRVANVDPLGMPVTPLPELNPRYHGLGPDDMERRFSAEMLAPNRMLPLRNIIEELSETYCNHIGVQFMHIDDLYMREWLQERMESTRNHITLSRDAQLRILTKLTDAVLIEEFIQKKFTGSKRFSLEGAESLIPLLDLAIEKAGDQGITEIVIGMAHRGRLNVLANIMGKRPMLIFREFADEEDASRRGGDVKYHKGYHNDWTTRSGKEIHLALCFNPSHLEFVNGTAMGRVRAKQDRLNDDMRDNSMVLLIHGDAAFAGEGVVQETLNLSQLEGYRVGGTLHVIVNNQIGFTTTPEDGRSGVYASDVAKMLQIPIFHVNGENPEAVAQAITLGMEFRKTFKRDVVIDMYCYRRWGHNEGDEPSFTQPVMYRAIGQRKPVRDGYLENLLKLNEVTQAEADGIVETCRKELDKELAAAREGKTAPAVQPSQRTSILGPIWRRYKGGHDADVEETGTSVNAERLRFLLERTAAYPESFTPHPKIVRLLELRQAMARGEKPLDWSAAEAMAFATLATEHYPIRLTGQDSRRGTFSHRHAMLADYQNGRPYMPLQHLEPGQARVEIYNSPLSESGVLAYEYGYSIAYPDALVIWEAQFGDFANCAQVLIDQGITSAEEKWRSLSGIVMLLPHGLEGMGPEHSSARIERFLFLAAEDNIQVVIPSTPAQLFHCLRRQVVRPWRKPLIVMTPKSLLRHPKVVSPLEDLAQGRFHRILPDAMGIRKKARRVLLCSGKIYYELEEERERLGRDDVAILRVEQLYPLQESYIEEALAPYSAKTEALWVQEEPENMGAWYYWRVRFCERLLGRPLRGVCRPASASPAGGSASGHRLEQRMLIEQAFAGI